MDTKELRVQQDQKNAANALVDDNEANNESEAFRMLINAGMVEYGFRGGKNGNTTLKQAASEFTRAFVWIGVAMLAITIMAPIELRIYALVPFALAFGSLSCYHVLEKHEPKITNKLRTMIGGETA